LPCLPRTGRRHHRRRAAMAPEHQIPGHPSTGVQDRPRAAAPHRLEVQLPRAHRL
jgi:hypothetical protein